MKANFRSLMMFVSFSTLLISGGDRAWSKDTGPVAHWSFDDMTSGGVRDNVSGTVDSIQGFRKLVPGVSGNGLRLDGYTTHIVRDAGSAPRIKDAVSVEAWVALQYYPWNWVPVAEQLVDEQVGFFFGIDAFGHVGLRVAVDGVWQSAISTAQLPLKKWAHIMGTFDPERGLTVYIDGKEAGGLAVKGRFQPASRSEILIGRVHEPTLTYPAYEPWHKVWYSIDGILDELSIYDRGLTAEEIQKVYASCKTPTGEMLPWPVLPSGPKSAGKFGAYYTTLKYEEVWDAGRRVGPNSDVVVRFDASPMRLVFWQGMNYIPAWVTENGKWYTDEFVEVYGEPVGCPDGGDCEPISDKQSRYSRVKIIESNDARVVIHWRYAVNEGVNYKGAWPDPLTGWFDWVDEYWTVYPDAVAVRKQVLWTSRPDKPHEWQETIIVNAPGAKPEDTINLDALIIGNMKGETATYTWESKPEGFFERSRGPEKVDRPDNPNIQLVNLKSAWKPFQVVSPEKSSFDVYNARSYYTFGCWNHWPVEQVVSPNRPCVVMDRVSHSSFSHIFWEPHATTENTITKLLLNGLTKKEAGELVTLAKSWLSSPALEISGAGFENRGYDPAQRAFVVERAGSDKAASLDLTLKASAESPAIHPAIVIKNWGDQPARLALDGKAVKWGQDFRVGLVESLEGTDLVVWISRESSTPLKIRLDAER